MAARSAPAARGPRNRRDGGRRDDHDDRNKHNNCNGHNDHNDHNDHGNRNNHNDRRGDACRSFSPIYNLAHSPSKNPDATGRRTERNREPSFFAAGDTTPKGKYGYFCTMEKTITESRAALFSALGEQLRTFIDSAPARELFARAEAANGWFTEREIRRALEAIGSRMLNRQALEKWLAAYDLHGVRPRHVGVIMAGNIPLVGFFDLLCVVACGHVCHYKPSAKDTVLTEWIVGRLKQLDPALPLFRYTEQSPIEAVIATGSDNTNRYFRMRYGSMPALLRGSRASAAVLTGGETAKEIEGLCDDILLYSGLGCRNVSLLFLPRGYDFAPLRRALARRQRELNPKWRNNYLQTRALAHLSAERYIDCGSAILCEKSEFPTQISRIDYAYYDEPEEAARWLREHDARIQCVVSGNPALHPRCVPFGEAQSPRLTDYPDAVDVIEFLRGIGLDRSAV